MCAGSRLIAPPAPAGVRSRPYRRMPCGAAAERAVAPERVGVKRAVDTARATTSTVTRAPPASRRIVPPDTSRSGRALTITIQRLETSSGYLYPALVADRA